MHFAVFASSFVSGDERFRVDTEREPDNQHIVLVGARGDLLESSLFLMHSCFGIDWQLV